MLKKIKLPDSGDLEAAAADFGAQRAAILASEAPKPSEPTADEVSICFGRFWDRCYYFKNIFGKIIGDFDPKYVELCRQKKDNVVFKKNANIFVENR
jgi:hypothetical protein